MIVPALRDLENVWARDPAATFAAQGRGSARMPDFYTRHSPGGSCPLRCLEGGKGRGGVREIVVEMRAWRGGGGVRSVPMIGRGLGCEEPDAVEAIEASCWVHGATQRSKTRVLGAQQSQRLQERDLQRQQPLGAASRGPPDARPRDLSRCAGNAHVEPKDRPRATQERPRKAVQHLIPRAPKNYPGEPAWKACEAIS